MIGDSSDRPALSIVAASRNDSHGGDLLLRMRLFVQGLLDQTRRFRFPAELIVVEWNPPPDRPRLYEVLPRPGADDYLTLRYVTVPAEIHLRHRHADEIPLYQMTAKNVGIRRARGQFILCTNVDLLFSDTLLDRLARTPLRKDTFYRANRCDVPNGVDPAWSHERQLAWCGRNVIRRLGRDPRYRNINLELLGLADKPRWMKWSFDKLALGLRLFWPPEKRAFYQLDAHACGDFTLMSREAWLAIGGYLELDVYSLHLDTLGVIAAAALGYRQEVLPPEACVYHLDHPVGWESMSPVEKIRLLEERPAIDYALVFELGLYALQRQRALELNPTNWGYADRDLEERTLASDPIGAAAVPAPAGG